MTYKFQNKVAIVTGGSSGIGKATALAFVRDGAKVVVADRQVEAGQALVKQIKEKGGEAHFVACDVSLDADVKNLVSQTIKQWGRLDYAFNNAGIEGEQGFIADSSLENWERVININLKGTFLCMKYEIPEMLKVGGGAIVNCSSIAGVVGFTGISPYVASKHGVIGLTKTVALEYATKNIRVNAVCPGVIQTPMIDRFTHGEAQALKPLVDGEPLGRMGSPEEIASAVLWLCSDGASFVTGHPLIVDGGWVAR